MIKNINLSRIKIIADKSQFSKVHHAHKRGMLDFLSVVYLLTLVIKPRNFSYTKRYHTKRHARKLSS